jgi:hypothetical protein
MQSPPLTPPSRPRRLLRFLCSWRPWIYLGVTGVWLGLMVQLWSREHGKGGKSLSQMGISPEVLQVSWTDYLQWLWIEQGGRRIGVTMTSIAMAPQEAGAVREAPSYNMESRTLVTLRVMGLSLPLDLATQVRMNAAFELETLQASLRTGGQELLIQAFAEHNNLYYRVRLDADRSTSESRTGLAGLNINPLLGVISQLPQREICGRTPLGESIFLTDAVLPVLTRSQTLKAGQAWATNAANPLTGMFHAQIRIAVEAREALEVNGERINAWRIAEQVGDVRTVSWYDANGKLVRSDLGSGMRLEQTMRSAAIRVYPNFDRDYAFRYQINREWIKTHLDPKLDGTPLGQLVPALPGM